MLIKNQNQRGIALAAVLVLLALAAVVAFAGWRVVANNENDQVGTSNNNTQQTTAPENITNTSELNQAEEAANDTPVESDLNPSQFDQDEENLL